ncbi:MAG: GerAB/ArcD/ProY family transporter [Ruminiclostridium sp.]
MIKEGKFGTIEAVALTTVVLITKAFYTSIRVLVKATSTSAWFATLISCGGSILLFLLVYLLMKRFPNKELLEIFEIVTGKFIGKLLALVFSAYFVYYAGSSLREFVEMIKAYVLPYTPPSAIILVFLGVVVFFAYEGLEGIARMAYVSFIIILIGLALILVLPMPFYNVDNLFPLAGYSLQTTLYAGLLRISAYSDVIFLAFIINAIHGVKQFKKVGLLSLALSGAIISATIFCSLLAFEFTQASENLSTLFQLSRIIYFNRFFQRVESIFIFIWVVASIINVALAFYMAASIFCKTFNIPDHRPSLLLFAFCTFTITLLPESLSEIVENNVLFLRQYSFFITYLIPILVLLLALIRGKKGEKIKVEKV